MTWLDGTTNGHDALLAAIVDALPEPLFVIDRDGRYVAVLGGAQDDLYHDGRTLVGKRMHDVLPRDVADRFLERVREALETGRPVSYQYELASDEIAGVESRPGIPNRLWFDAHIAPIASAGDRDDMVVWMIFNINDSKLAMSRLEAQQAELERLARTDPLTGLLNRRSFFQEADRELQWVRRTGQPAALIVFDLDHFKLTNDTWGHAAGDRVLRAVAELLHRRRRSTDLVGRLGGEEFAMVVRGAHLEAGERLADRLRAEIERLEVTHDRRTLGVTGSFGVSEMRTDDHDPESALRRADAAMYRAKRLGRNRVERDTPSDPGE